MPRATTITLGYSRRTSANYQSSETHVEVTYDLDSNDLIAEVVKVRSAEVRSLHDQLSAGVTGPDTEPAPEVADDTATGSDTSTPPPVAKITLAAAPDAASMPASEQRLTLREVLDGLPDPKGDRIGPEWDEVRRTTARELFQSFARNFGLTASGAKAVRTIIQDTCPVLSDVQFSDFSVAHWAYASECLRLKHDPGYQPFEGE